LAYATSGGALLRTLKGPRDRKSAGAKRLKDEGEGWGNVTGEEKKQGKKNKGAEKEKERGGGAERHHKVREAYKIDGGQKRHKANRAERETGRGEK